MTIKLLKYKIGKSKDARITHADISNNQFVFTIQGTIIRKKTIKDLFKKLLCIK